MALEFEHNGGGTARSAPQQIASTDLGFAAGDALRVEDVMQILHLSRNTVYKLAREGALPSYKVGRQIRFRYDDVRRRLEQVADDADRSYVAGGFADPMAETSPAAASPAEQATLPVPGDVLDELPSWAHGSVVLGGQDLSSDLLANYLSALGVKLLRSHANAYMSLSRMYAGGCHACVVDLWSEREKTYNTPYVRTFLPGVPAISFRLVKRRVGLTVAARNPLGFSNWADLLKPDTSLANRERGAGTRVLLDEKLKYLEARGEAISGYERPVSSELAQALMVARGIANVAVTSEKPLRQIKGVDFLPMQDEVLDLVVLKTPGTAGLIKAVRSLLRTDALRGEFDPTLYDTRLMGEVVYEC